MTTTSTPRGRALLSRPDYRAPLAAALTVLLLVAVFALVDPSGLLAPVGGHGLPLVGTGGVFRWAPLLIGLPITLVGTALPVAVVARAGRPVFVVTWAATVGAVSVAAAVTGFVIALPTVGPSLSILDALRFAFTTSGFAGLKGLVAGPLVAVVAVLAHRSTPRGARRRAAVRQPVLVMLAVMSLAAVGFAATAWRGGSVGYAFVGPLVAPTVSAGVLGTLAGIALFGLVFAWLVRRWATSGVVVAVWLAAVVAGVVLGFVDAIIAAVAYAGSDSWWFATTVISLATGIGYGVTVGLLAAAVTWAVRRVRLPHLPRLVVAAVAVVLVAIPLVLPAPSPSSPSAVAPVQATGVPRLQLLPGDPPVIGDETGRQVLLRGVNVNQLIDYYLRHPDVPATGPLTDRDFAGIASMGFNVVRLGMSWSRLEPMRGEFDERYLDKIRAAVVTAKKHGIYTVLDLHQDAWGNALAAPDEECGGGTSPTTGWDGAPTWATITDGTLHCEFLARDLAPAVATAFSNFYTDRDGIQTELVRTWAKVAQEFADEPAVAGYDLLNEPGIGTSPPITSSLLLGRYYDEAITAIRAAESATPGGFAHLAFFEPSVLWSGLAFDVTPPPGFTDDTQIVFAPHPYSESITLDQSLGFTIASIERNLSVSKDAARSYGAALWAGEWGWFGDPAVDGAKVERFVTAQDELGIGGAFWVWRQGCGSPETGDDATSSGNFVSVDCQTGELSPPPEEYATPLTRAYPRVFPGTIDSLVSDATQVGLSFAATSDDDAVSCDLDIWVPGAAEPSLDTTGVTDVSVDQVPGGWQVTGCATGRYTVSAS